MGRIKKRLSIKWMLGVMIILMAIAYGTNQASKNISMSASDTSSQNIFLQFLENMFGWNHGNSSSSNGASKRSSAANQTRLNSGQMGGVNAGNQQDLDSMTSAGASSSKNLNASQKESNPENTGGNYAGNNAGNNTEGDTDLNAENNAQDNSVITIIGNSDNSSDNNSQTNAENNADNNMQNNSGGSSETSADQGTGNNSGGNSGGGSGNTSGDNSGTGADQGTGNTSGGLGYIAPNNLPTINPIPSNNQVLQSIAQQNQNNDSLAALVASRQALVVPVQQQAEASKYQTVNAGTIPPPSTNQPPADVEAKVQSHQLTYH